MDPLSAFSLATNILTFVEFSYKLVADARAVYKSVAGTSDNNRALETIATQITQQNSLLVSLPTYPKDLQALCVECNNVASDLLLAIKKLRGKGKNRGWESFKVALREIWGQAKIDNLEERLQQLQQQLIARMQFLILDKQSSVGQEIAKISLMNERFNMEANRRLAGLEADILQVLDAIKSHPENLFEQAGILSARLIHYSEEAKSTAWNQRLIESLYYPRFQSRHDAISAAHASTFEWMLNDTKDLWKKPRRFVEWLRLKNGTFFVQGKAGSGKSTLMKFLWHHPSTRKHLTAWAGVNKLVMASYFFWAAGDELQKSEEGLIRALLFEILRACPDLISGIKEELGATATLIQQPHTQMWTHPTLLKVFDVLMNQEFKAKFCFFIDGLDEYKGNTQNLIELVRKLVSYPGIKICLSSRPWAEFRHAFETGANACWNIKLEDLTKDDIRQYVNDRLNANTQFSVLRVHDASYFDIAEQVMSRAQGVFLWVVLAVRSLLEGANYDDSISDMRRRLDEIPDDLEDFFKLMLHSIPEFYRPHAALTFNIAIAAESPLPLVIYGYADDVNRDPEFAISAPVRPISETAIETMNKQTANRLDGRCKGLLEVVKHENPPNAYHAYEVNFLHRTVRDFLVGSNETLRHFDNGLKNDLDAYLALCHAHLANLKRTWPRYMIASKAEYVAYGTITSVNSFMQCAKKMQDRFGDTRSINNVFNEAKRVFKASGVYQGESLFDGTAVHFGLESYVTQQLFSSALRVQRVGGREHDLLGYALFDRRFVQIGGGFVNPTIVNYLLDRGANPNYDPEGQEVLTLWGNFVNYCYRGRTLTHKKGFQDVRELDKTVFSVMGALIKHGADLGYEIRRGETTRDVLRMMYPDECEELFAKAPRLLAMRHALRRARRRLAGGEGNKLDWPTSLIQ
ncbi:hypothetical protein PG984_003660 [Apiospora sp. TS-2023a]